MAAVGEVARYSVCEGGVAVGAKSVSGGSSSGSDGGDDGGGHAMEE